MSDTITAYYGEFLVSPVPLELSGNWCSHNCPYCFANLNKPNRSLDLKTTLNILTNFRNRKSLECRLLAEGYPVLVSNHIDPFSISNFRQMVPLMRSMTDMGIPLSIQTRGGVEKAIAETISFLPPSVWYISITHSSDETRKVIEPAAPSVEHRLELIRKVVKLGHKVIVGFNPCVPEWTPDLRGILTKIQEAGAEGIWAEIMHFNYKQIAKMSSQGRAAIGEDIIKAASKRNADELHFAHFWNALEIARELGMQTFHIGQWRTSKIFDCFGKLYPKTFPTMQEFVNHCAAQNIRVFPLIYWTHWCLSRLPSIPANSQMSRYIYSKTQTVQMKKLIPWKLDYSGVLTAWWLEPKIKCANLLEDYNFALIIENDECYTPDGMDVPWVYYNNNAPVPLLKPTIPIIN